jgi:hypothetical protein
VTRVENKKAEAEKALPGSVTLNSQILILPLLDLPEHPPGLSLTLNRHLRKVDKYVFAVLGRVRALSIPLFQERPELLFVPLTGVCLLLSMAPFAYGWQWGQNFVHYLVSPTANQISPVTWSAAWVTFGTTFFLMFRWTRLNALRCAMVGASIPFGATGLFEVLFQGIGLTFRPLWFHWGPYDWFVLLLWTSIGITGVPFWKITRLFWFSLAVFVGGFSAWVLAGYPQATWGTIESVPVAYGFNIILKAMAFVLFSLPLLQGIRRSRVAQL